MLNSRYQSYETPITLSINSLGILKTFFGISRQSLRYSQLVNFNLPVENSFLIIPYIHLITNN